MNICIHYYFYDCTVLTISTMQPEVGVLIGIIILQHSIAYTVSTSS